MSEGLCVITIKIKSNIIVFQMILLRRVVGHENEMGHMSKSWGTLYKRFTSFEKVDSILIIKIL